MANEYEMGKDVAALQIEMQQIKMELLQIRKFLTEETVTKVETPTRQ